MLAHVGLLPASTRKQTLPSLSAKSKWVTTCRAPTESPVLSFSPIIYGIN